MHQVRWVVCAMIGFFLLSVMIGDFSARLNERSLADLGAVGVTAAVETNEFNLLAQELRAKETDLNAKEAALNERELAILREREASNMLSSRYFVWGAILLFALVIANLYFDFEILHAEKNRPVPNP